MFVVGLNMKQNLQTLKKWNSLSCPGWNLACMKINVCVCVCAHACVRACECVCVSVSACVHMYALGIVSLDTILHFTNTFIIMKKFLIYHADSLSALLSVQKSRGDFPIWQHLHHLNPEGRVVQRSYQQENPPGNLLWWVVHLHVSEQVSLRKSLQSIHTRLNKNTILWSWTTTKCLSA